MICRRTLLATAGPGLIAATRAQGAVLEKPAGPVILTITGSIGVTNQDDAAVFDRAMLEAMGMTSFQTHTPWYSEPVTFEGVPMTTLMDRVQAKGQTLGVTALNDYTSEIPIADFGTWHPIMALRRDGHYMEVRDKGPLFVVYPYDSSPELQSQRFYSRSAWQIARMDVR